MVALAAVRSKGVFSVIVDLLHNVLPIICGSSVFVFALIRGYNILFRFLTFAKPECDNVLQPEPRSGEGCNTLLHVGLANVNIRKRMLYRHCYIPPFLTQAVPNNFIQLSAKMFTVTS